MENRLQPPFQTVELIGRRGRYSAYRVLCELNLDSLIQAQGICAMCLVNKEVQQESGKLLDAQCTGIMETNAQAVIEVFSAKGRDETVMLAWCLVEAFG